MATFRIGQSVLEYVVIGAGVRNGWLPAPLDRVGVGWGELDEKQLSDLEAFEAAGWRFHQQPDLDWRAAEDINGGRIQAGLLARHPRGGLVILLNYLVVSLPRGMPPSSGDDAEISKIPLNRNVYNVRLRLPNADLEGAIVRRIAKFKEVVDKFDQEIVAEPLILYHLQHPGDLYSIGTGIAFRVKTDPTIQNHWTQILLEEAWDAGTKGSGTRVAVLDLGFDVNETQIKSNIAETAFVNDQGYEVPNAKIPVNSHGTLCAGLVGALLDKRTVNGAAPECSLMLVAVESITTQIALSKAIELCTAGIGGKPGADVISCSLGLKTQSWELSSELQKSVDAAHAIGRGTLGTLIVWADFNASDPIPSDSVEGYPGILCVGQCNSSNRRVSCGYGPGLDLVAPGVNVNVITGTENGASCAAPQVAGVAALVLAKRMQDQRPSIKWDALAKVITDNCHRPNHPNSRTDDDGWGRLDAKLAVENA